MVGTDRCWLNGKVAQGPHYCLYLASKYVETEPGFQTIKAQSLRGGLFKAFENLPLDLTDGVDVTNYRVVMIWCKALGQFITVADLQ